MTKVDPTYPPNEMDEIVALFSKREKERQAKIREAEIVLSEASISKHKVGYRATQVMYSVPCFTGYDVKVGQRFAMLYPIHEFMIDDYATIVPEHRFYPGTVIELIGTDNPMMKFKFDGGPGGCEWIMCGVKEYLRYCIPIPDLVPKFLGHGKEFDPKPTKKKTIRKKKNVKR